MKLCTSCKQIKDNSEFYKNKARYDGLENRCKNCTKERNKRYSEENKEYFTKKKADYYQYNKETQNAKYKKNKIKAMEKSELDVHYSTIHKFIKRIKTKPEMCEKCYKIKSLELASIGHTYTRDPLDWKYLCRECHIAFDRAKPSLKSLISGTLDVMNKRDAREQPQRELTKAEQTIYNEVVARTDAGSARQTEGIKFWKLVAREDLEKIREYNNRNEKAHSHTNQYLINEILEKYLSEEEHDDG